ncbi:MAG: 2-hydroxyacyl-CoA dehydratase family protein [Clostridiales bacterium]|nr:2-hydroxyacyl-CoA dehydratase family protein [Clostridiales bacterium]
MLETKGKKAKELLGYYQKMMIDQAWQAKREGRPVGWSSSIAPPEMCVAMDMALVYPENHAAGIGAKHGALDMIEVAERSGYSIDNCSYSRINLAYMELLKEEAETGITPEALKNCPGDRLPLPDFVIFCNNICNTLNKWYENLAKELDIPCIIIDVPFNHTMPVAKHNKAYIADQFRNAISQIEVICGRPFDYDKFREARHQTVRSGRAWKTVANMANYKPSPLSGFDFFNYMALIVCARAYPCAEITFNKLLEELQEKQRNGETAYKGNEKTRIAWEGIAVWPYLGHTLKSLKNQGTIMIGSTYPDLWAFDFDADDETLYSMAEAYSRQYINTNFENRVKVLSDIVINGQCDGVIYHTNRSCKLMIFINSPEIAEAVSEKTGTPFVFFDGDQTDPRNFSPAQYDTRVQALGEIMEERIAAQN